MDIKKLVLILVIIVLVAFGTGIYSLRYNDNFGPISFDGRNELNISLDGSNVRIGLDGIDVRDGDDHVKIGWDGINVKGGEDEVNVGWDGVKVKDGEDVRFDLLDISSWFRFNKNLRLIDVDEQKNVGLNGIENIKVNSSFIDIKVVSEDRQDILIDYHGKLKSNVIPTLEVYKNGNTLNIDLLNHRSSYSVTESNVVLEVCIPNIYNGSLKTINSSGDITIYDIIVDELNVVASSGDVRIEKLETENMYVVTSSGNHVLKDINGDIFDLVASSGNISSDNVNGNYLNVQTSSGDISTKDCTGEFNLSTSSGDITLFNQNNYKHYKISTNSGDIEVTLPNNSNYTIIGSSSSGRYTPSSNMNVQINNRGDFKANIGNGENIINITTSSGDVRFR